MKMRQFFVERIRPDFCFIKMLDLDSIIAEVHEPSKVLSFQQDKLNFLKEAENKPVKKKRANSVPERVFESADLRETLLE
jgi:hypothetical protein